MSVRWVMSDAEREALLKRIAEARKNGTIIRSVEEAA